MSKILKVLMGLSLAFVAFAGTGSRVWADDNAAGDYTDKVLLAKQLLGLTDDQISKLQSIRSAAKAEAGPVVIQYLVDLKSLKTKVETGASDADLTTLLNKMESERQNLEGMKTKYIAQVRAVLNPMQQGKVALIIAKIKFEALKKLKS